MSEAEADWEIFLPQQKLSWGFHYLFLCLKVQRTCYYCFGWIFLLVMNFECDYVTSVLNMLCCLWTMICVQYFVTESNKYTYTISTVFPFYKAFLKCPIPPGRHQEILSDCGFRRYERMFWSGNSVPFWSENSVLFWQKLWHFRKMGKFEVPNDSPEEDELHELFQISIHQKILWRSIQWRFQCTLRAFDPMIFSQRVGLLCTWRVSTFQERLSMNVAIVAKGWARSKL